MSDNDKVICPNCAAEFAAIPVNVQSKLTQLEDRYGNECKLVADMHLAAMGGVCGPRLGVVEDVRWLRERFLQLQAENEANLAECEALRKDAERLNWINENPDKLSRSTGYRGSASTWTVRDCDGVAHDFMSIRNAIDLARQP